MLLRVDGRRTALSQELSEAARARARPPFGRAGDVIQRPPSWAALAGLMALTGPRGRRAALSGGACYLGAAMAHLPIKAVVGRKHPPGAALHQLGPFRPSFPSGHAAAHLAFTFGAANELPRPFFPLSLWTMAVHWSLLRKRAHYPSDVLVGGMLGLAVAAAPWILWSPKRPEDGSPGPGGGAEVRDVDDGTPGAAGAGLTPTRQRGTPQPPRQGEEGPACHGA